MSKKMKVPKLVDPRLVKAMADPIRSHALNILNQRPSSPSQIAKELGLENKIVDYHVKELVKLGAIEQIAERGVDGATANIYKANVRQFFEDEAWAQVPEEKRLPVTMSIIGLISGDLNNAIAGGTLEARGDSHISRTPMTVDEEGWQEVAELLARVLDEVISIQANATSRIAASGEEALLTKVVIMHFVSPPGQNL